MGQCQKGVLKYRWYIRVVLNVCIVAAIPVVLRVGFSLGNILVIKTIHLTEPFLDATSRSCFLRTDESIFSFFGAIFHGNKED